MWLNKRKSRERLADGTMFAQMEPGQGYYVAVAAVETEEYHDGI